MSKKSEVLNELEIKEDLKEIVEEIYYENYLKMLEDEDKEKKKQNKKNKKTSKKEIKSNENNSSDLIEEKETQVKKRRKKKEVVENKTNNENEETVGDLLEINLKEKNSKENDLKKIKIENNSDFSTPDIDSNSNDATVKNEGSIEKVEEVDLDSLNPLEKLRYQQEQNIKNNLIKAEKELKEQELQNNLIVSENLKQEKLKDYFFNEKINGYFLRQTIQTIRKYPEKVNGILFIGDVHITKKAPKRRLDENFQQTVLNKLIQIKEFANKYNLLPVCKGDLFHYATENSLDLLNDLGIVLKEFKHKLIVLRGNHDQNEKTLNKNNMLYLLNSLGIVEAIENNGFIYRIDIIENQNLYNNSILQKYISDEENKSNEKENLYIETFLLDSQSKTKKANLRKNNSNKENALELVGLNNVKTVLLGATPYGEYIPDCILPLLVKAEDELLEKIGLNLTQQELENLIYIPLTDKEIKNIEKQEENNKKTGSNPIKTERDWAKLLKNDLFEKEQQLINIMLEQNNISDVIWLTHHDLAMSGSYPNSIPLKNIMGVSKIINGHIHDRKKAVKIGETVYYNKGNITRLSIDTVNHLPSVFLYDPFLSLEEASITGEMVKELVPFVINHKEGKEIFNLEGKHVSKDTITQEEIDKITQDIEDEEGKVFAKMLESREETYKSNDSTLMQETLKNFLEENDGLSENVKKYLINLSERITTKTIEE